MKLKDICNDMSYIVAALHHYCLDPMEKLIVDPNIIHSVYFEIKSWQVDFRKLLLLYRAFPYSTTKLDTTSL